MSANASARRTKIFIGADQQEWTQSLVSLTVGYALRDKRGLLPILGDLTLAYVNDSPESMNTRINQARWFRGQVVRVQVENASGTFIDHPLGLFYILKEPMPITLANPTLTLQIGCILSLRDFDEPNDDKSQITLGTAVDRTTPINTLVTAAKAGTYTGTTSLYPVSTPIPKQGGSYIQQAGELAFAGFQALYQKRNGEIVSVDLTLDPLATPLLTATIGRDEILYTPSEGSETPVEVLTATAVGQDLTNNYTGVSSCADDYAPALGYIMRRTCTSDSQTNTAKVRRVTVSEPLAILLPDLYEGNYTFGLSSDTTETYTFENLDGGKLTRLETVTTKMAGVALAEIYSALTPAEQASFRPTLEIPAERSTTIYTYNSRELLVKTVTTVIGLVGSVLTDLDPTTGSQQVIVSTSTESYEEVRPNNWTKTNAETACFITAYPDGLPEDASINAKLVQVTTDFTSTASSSQNQPPAAERKPDQFEKKDKQLKGKAQFGTFAGAEQQQRERTIEVKYASSETQLKAIAQNEGAILIGRRLGQQIHLPLLDAFLTCPPLPVIDCREPVTLSDGSVVYDLVRYQADALQYIHTLDQAMVACNGIWLAQQAHNATVLALPYKPIIDIDLGFAFGINFTIVDYGFTGATQAINLGFAFGLTLSIGVVAFRSVNAPILRLSTGTVTYTAGINRSVDAPILRLSTGTVTRTLAASRSMDAPILMLSTGTVRIVEYIQLEDGSFLETEDGQLIELE